MRTSTHMRPANAGFTLIELMIVVAVVAVLAGISVVAYSRHMKNGRIVEAHEMIGQIQMRQESYFQTAGSYCNASGGGNCTEGGAPTYHPTLSTDFTPQVWDPTTAGLPGWTDLSVRVPKGRLYFSYVSAAGIPSDSYATRGDAAALGLSAGRPWYYIIARADMGADGAPYTEISVTNLREHEVIQNRGE